MNNPEEFLSDKALDEAMAPLRSVTVSKAIHEANMVAVHQALASRVQPSWWRRSVAIPLPLVAAATLAFVFITGVLFNRLLDPESASKEPSSQFQAESNAKAAQLLQELVEEAPVWSKTQSYIHSLVNSRVLDTPAAKGNRDDS